MNITDKDRERFFSKIEIGSCGCHLWKGGTLKEYGSFALLGKTKLAHRLAWEISRGPIPDGLFVCHRCDNPRCVNPDHLFVGTHTDNMRDMHSKGRGRCLDEHGQAKLKETDVIEIRKSNLSNSELAARYGVGKTTIFYARKGINWKRISIT